MMNNVITALKGKFNSMDTVEKVLVTAFMILLIFIAVSYIQGFIGGGTTGAGGAAGATVGGASGTGGRGGSGLGGLGMLGRGLGQ